MNFLNDSYGLDFLSIFLILVSSFFNLFYFTRILASIILILALYRVFSKNIYKRDQELKSFCIHANKFLGKFNRALPNNLPVFHFNHLEPIFSKITKWFNEKRNFKIVKCPRCSQKLRLPRHKGRITVTCKRCLHEFKLKT